MTTLYHDDDAVSPVIGVILMVAITVILAAVIASFVLGTNGPTTQAPQFSTECDLANGEITHTGGDDVEKSNLELVDVGASASLTGSISTFDAGDTIASATTASDISEDTQLKWTDPEGGSSAIVAEC